VQTRRGYTPVERGEGGVAIMGDTGDSLDAMTAAPAHHRVLLVNHRVRVLAERGLRILAIEIQATI